MVDDPELALAAPTTDPDDPEQSERLEEALTPEDAGFKPAAGEESDPN